MTQKLGFIGAGNIAAAIIGGVVNRGTVAAENIVASDTDNNRLAFIEGKYNIRIVQSNKEVALSADMIFLSVKPHIYDMVIDEIRTFIKPGALVIILAAGLEIENVRGKFGAGSEVKLVKAMPNTPAMVNCGMTAVCAAENVTPKELERVLEVFNGAGKTEILSERLFDVFTAMAGSSPAYVLMFIEAMADAGVKHGLSRTQAVNISTQAVLGTAKLLQETGEHPAALKDGICTPGGTTIEAVCELEARGFRSAVISAITAVVEKYNELKG